MTITIRAPREVNSEGLSELSDDLAAGSSKITRKATNVARIRGSCFTGGLSEESRKPERPEQEVYS